MKLIKGQEYTTDPLLDSIPTLQRLTNQVAELRQIVVELQAVMLHRLHREDS